MSECNICAEVKKWIAHPYKEDGTVFDWFLFLGLVALITFAWSRILVRMT